MANRFNIVKPGTGVNEWADFSYNIGTGCSNNCRYCYAYGIAADIARDNNRVLTRAGWQQETVNVRKAGIHQHEDGVVMFPSMHDITLGYLPTAITTIRNMLDANNWVLIVTKPRLECIRRLCDEIQEHRDKLLIRMTITSLNAELSRFWEPGAPLPAERLSALRHAHDNGFMTSVSVEPMIDSFERTIELYHTVYPYLSYDIWIGKMNDIDRRVAIDSQQTREAVSLIKQQQDDANIHLLYQRLKHADKVKWKDSIRNVVGLES